MSPPSEIDSSSDTESEEPLQKRLAIEDILGQKAGKSPKNYLKHKQKNG